MFRTSTERDQSRAVVLIGIGSVLQEQLGHGGEAQKRRAEKRRLAQVIHTVHVYT